MYTDIFSIENRTKSDVVRFVRFFRGLLMGWQRLLITLKRCPHILQPPLTRDPPTPALPARVPKPSRPGFSSSCRPFARSACHHAGRSICVTKAIEHWNFPPTSPSWNDSMTRVVFATKEQAESASLALNTAIADIQSKRATIRDAVASLNGANKQYAFSRSAVHR